MSMVRFSPLSNTDHNFRDRRSRYMSFVPNSRLREPRMIYSYSHATNAFSAMLTQDEVETMEGMDRFLLAYPDWEFKTPNDMQSRVLWVEQGGRMWFDSVYGRDRIIEMTDTGIKYGHPSNHGPDLLNGNIIKLDIIAQAPTL